MSHDPLRDKFAAVMKLTWTETRAPYPYVSSREPKAIVLAHPAERTLWVLALEKNAGGVFRYRDGAFELVCRRDAFAHPSASFDDCYAFFDSKRGTPVVVFDDWAGKNVGQVQALRKSGELSLIYAADYDAGASSFRERALSASGEIEYGDTLYESHGELFHVYRPNGRPALFRVLRDDSFHTLSEAPAQLAEPGTMGGCVGAYDEHLGAHVFVCNDAAMAFDGSSWREIAVPPGAGHLGDRDLAFTDPSTGHALFVQEPDGNTPAVVHRFDGKAWREVGPGPLTWQGACVDPVRKAIVFFQARRDAGSAPATFVVWDGERMRDEGPELGGDGTVVTGELGRIELGRDATRWQPRSGATVVCPKSLWSPVVTPNGPLAFESTGAVWGIDGGAWSRIADPPTGFKERVRMATAWDPTRGATLLISGTPTGGNAMLKDVWAFDGTKLDKVAWKPPLSAIDAGAAYSAALGKLIVAGGKQKWKGAPAPTYEVDRDRTTAFEPAAIGDTGDSAALTADPKTGLVVGTSFGKAAVYLGGGTWQPIPDVPEHAHYVWFDATTRMLHARASDGPIRSEHACALGDWLAALPAPKPAEPTAPREQAPLGPIQNLVYVGGGSNKFWTARLADSEYTIEWGKRGAKSVATKKYELDSPAKARAHFERATRKKLDEGYVAHAGDPRVLAGKTAHTLKLASAAAQNSDRWGGEPPYFDAASWPRCSDCANPLAFVMLLHKHAERLPLTKHDAVAVFVCNRDCETYDARAGNHVALLTAAQLAKASALPDQARIIQPKRIEYAPRFEADAAEDIERKPAWNKVGGYPDFIQGKQSVACAECGTAMTWIAQFTDDLDRQANLNFGDRGCGYVVICPDEHDAAFFWQCY